MHTVVNNYTINQSFNAENINLFEHRQLTTELELMPAAKALQRQLAVWAVAKNNIFILGNTDNI